MESFRFQLTRSSFHSPHNHRRLRELKLDFARDGSLGGTKEAAQSVVEAKFSGDEPAVDGRTEDDLPRVHGQSEYNHIVCVIRIARGAM